MNINRFPNTLTGNRAINRPIALQKSAHQTGFQDFKHLRSRSKPIMCDEELKEAVREQARADAARGEFDWEGREFTRLREAFISVVSPDRRSLVANHPSMLANLHFGAAAPPMLMVGHGGEIVAGFDVGRGWSVSITQAEAARQKIISDVYHDAWMAARHGVDAPVRGRFDSRG